MKVLLAEDDSVTMAAVSQLVRRWDYDVICVNNGHQAWKALQAEETPLIVLADWQMPGMNGDELCRRAREHSSGRPLHMILLTATPLTIEKKVGGLSAGADDYLSKPYDARELLARLQVGERVLALQMELRSRVEQLEEALAQVKQLQGLLPICVDCKKIRDDQNYWHKVENYLAARTDVAFTHGFCPECFVERMKEVAQS